MFKVKTVEGFSIKEDSIDNGAVLRIAGYASTYEPLTNPDSYGDIIAPNAIDFKAKLPMLDGHKTLVGLWDTIENDAEAKRGKSGLWVEGYLLPVTSAKDLEVLLKAGVITGLSAGIWVKQFSLHRLESGQLVTQIDKATLAEVSLTPFPANDNASIEAIKNKEQSAFDLRSMLSVASQTIKQLKG